MSQITGIGNPAPDTEIATMDTRSAAPGTAVAPVLSTSVSICAAIATFSGLSAGAKRPGCNTICNMAAVRGDASAANWRPEPSHEPHRHTGPASPPLLIGSQGRPGVALPAAGRHFLTPPLRGARLYSGRRLRHDWLINVCVHGTRPVANGGSGTNLPRVIGGNHAGSTCGKP